MKKAPDATTAILALQPSTSPGNPNLWSIGIPVPDLAAQMSDHIIVMRQEDRCWRRFPARKNLGRTYSLYFRKNQRYIPPTPEQTSSHTPSASMGFLHVQGADTPCMRAHELVLFNYPSTLCSAITPVVPISSPCMYLPRFKFPFSPRQVILR